METRSASLRLNQNASNADLEILGIFICVIDPSPPHKPFSHTGSAKCVDPGGYSACCQFMEGISADAGGSLLL